MTVLVAAVLGVNLGIFAALYWQQLRARHREWYDQQLRWLKYWEQRMHGRPDLASRLRWYTLR